MVEVWEDIYDTNDKTGDIICIRILAVPESPEYPEGVKYRMAFIHNNERLLGYDNIYPEGHHKHVLEKKYTIIFPGVYILMRRFRKEVDKLKEELYGHKNQGT